MQTAMVYGVHKKKKKKSVAWQFKYGTVYFHYIMERSAVEIDYSYAFSL